MKKTKRFSASLKLPKLSLEGFVKISILLLVIWAAMYSRMSTLGDMIMDYDPWWFFRHSLEMLNNGLMPLKWDLQSFFPPGRPTEPWVGWEYTMIFFYEVAKLLLPGISFNYVANASPVIMVGLIALVGFLLGKHVSGSFWGGIAAAIFSSLSPAFVGVSMAGYCDTDASVLFYTYLTVLTTLMAMKKPNAKNLILATLSMLGFAVTWNAAWYIQLIFIASILGYVVVAMLESLVAERKLKLKVDMTAMKNVLLAVGVVIVVSNIFGAVFNLYNLAVFIVKSVGFLQAKQIVNVSVAELQPINIFTAKGFWAVAQRVGLLPFLLSMIGFPLIVIWKLFKSKGFTLEEIFLMTWLLATFVLIMNGVRFSLLFAASVSVVAGYVISYVIKFLSDANKLVKVTVFSVLIILVLNFLSVSMAIGKASTGMQVEKEWIDMLDWLVENAKPKSIVVTWWDPGHIIAGYTYWKGNPLYVHADGAHCYPEDCYPYPHNTRIKDMGKVFSTNNETVAINVLKKYVKLTPEQCEEVKRRFDDRVPEQACEPVSEMYVIASNDLVFKYPWLSYFGEWNNVQKQYLLLELTDQIKDENGKLMGLEYGNGIVVLLFKNNSLVPILNKRLIISELIYTQKGNIVDLNVPNGTIGSLLLLGDISQGFPRQVVFMPRTHEEAKRFMQCADCSKGFNCPGQYCQNGKDDNFNRLVDERITLAERDAIFTKMFFLNGYGLKHFKLVYSNPKIKIFKVVW